MVEMQFGLVRWKEEYPVILGWWEGREGRESWREMRFVVFELEEKVA